MKRLLLALARLAAACQTSTTAPPTTDFRTGAPPQRWPIAPDTPQRLAQLPRTVIDYDRSLLNDNERQVVAKLIEASKQIDEIYWRQVVGGEPGVARRSWRSRRRIAARPRRLRLLHRQQRSVGPARRTTSRSSARTKKPAGAAFYPRRHDEGRIREVRRRASRRRRTSCRDSSPSSAATARTSSAIPYSAFYNDFLEPAAAKLREAAALTNDASLKRFLTKRADAFASDDYRDSDMAWMDLNGTDRSRHRTVRGLRGQSLQLQGVVRVVRHRRRQAGEREARRVRARAAGHGAQSPRAGAVQESEPRHASRRSRWCRSSTPPATRGAACRRRRSICRTTKFVREKKGSKKVLLKNVMDAKFRQSGKPIAHARARSVADAASSRSTPSSTTCSSTSCRTASGRAS